MIDLGYMIRKRKELDLRQAEVAKRSGVSQAYVSQYESGRRIPSRQVFKSWCAVLGIDPLEAIKWE